LIEIAKNGKFAEKAMAYLTQLSKDYPYLFLLFSHYTKDENDNTNRHKKPNSSIEKELKRQQDRKMPTMK